MNDNSGFFTFVGVAMFVVFIILGIMFGYPMYSVWQQGLAGEAEFKRAEQNRRITIEEAKAKAEAAKMLNVAEVERARGVAEANKIIGDSLTGNEAYLRYLWIQGMQTNEMQVIYIPTEAGLPLLEAARNIK